MAAATREEDCDGGAVRVRVRMGGRFGFYGREMWVGLHSVRCGSREDDGELGMALSRSDSSRIIFG